MKTDLRSPLRLRKQRENSHRRGGLASGSCHVNGFATLGFIFSNLSLFVWTNKDNISYREGFRKNRKA